jgi:hypothetical protein
MIQKYRRLLKLAAILFVALLLVALAIGVAHVSAPPPLPNPNGYDDFVMAGEAVSGTVGNASELDYEELEALISANAQPLRLFRLGLARQCRMPADLALTNAAELTSQLSSMKRLAQLLAAEGRLLEMDNRPAAAARSYTDCIRLGNEISRGGLLITRLVGIACEAIGYQALAKIVPKLTQDEARDIQRQLEQIDAQRVSWAEVVQSEEHCIRQHFQTSLNPITLVASWWNMRRAMERAEARHRTVIAHERLLAAELALRCYESDHKRGPACLADLVTNYLSKLPQDPFSGSPLVYRQKPGTGWLLYSVGPDGVDDGGRPAGRGWPVKGDIVMDSAW